MRSALFPLVSLVAAAAVSAAPQGIFPAKETLGVSHRTQMTSGESNYPRLSLDGRIMVFVSDADDLVPGDTNGESDVFVYRRLTRQLDRVSVTTNGDEADGMSFYPVLSPEGRYVLFFSDAANLIPKAGAEFWAFLHDRWTSTTEPIAPVNAHNAASLSMHARRIAFATPFALVPEDTNGVMDIYVFERETGTFERVSVRSSGAQLNHPSSKPWISADGSTVAFQSPANALVPGDHNNEADVFVVDLETRALERASITWAHEEADGRSTSASLSANGQYVCFQSTSENIVPIDGNGRLDIFVHDRVSGETRLISENFARQRPGLSDEAFGWITGDGRHIVFCTRSAFVPGDVNGLMDIYVRNLWTGDVELVSRTEDGALGNDISWRFFASYDARFVAFSSRADNLVPGDQNTVMDVFLHDRLAGRHVPLGR